MAKFATTKDLYMNFKDVEVDLDSTTSTATLVEAETDTGLTIRGGLVWLLHLIEWYFSDDAAAASVTQIACLSTVAGQATMPELTDKGTIAKAQSAFQFATGVGFQFGLMQPFAQHYLPPIPIASPQICLYAKTNVDNSNLDGDTIRARIGFTTAPLDNAMYTEIAETWGW